MTKVKLDLDKVEQAVEHSATAVPYPRTTISNVLEAIIDGFGKLFSWAWVLLMILVVLNVVLRYAFNSTFVALEELQWHIYAIGFMIGLSYCVLKDGHVRVDVIAEQLSPRKRATIELFGTVLFLVPFCLLVLYNAYPFVERAFVMGETSANPGGLPMRWVIKSVILLAFGLLLMAAIARAARALSLLTGFPRPLPDARSNQSGKTDLL
ncbi:MAG: TRAP transporter small permease subunit [Saccharospirillum sp.]